MSHENEPVATRVVMAPEHVPQHAASRAERRVSRAGKDSIDHAPHGHDDLANAVAGVADATRLQYYDPFMGCGSEYEQHPPPTPGWKLAGFGSQEEAEAYKARARAQYGRSVSFPWDGYSG